MKNIKVKIGAAMLVVILCAGIFCVVAAGEHSAQQKNNSDNGK